MSTDKYIVTVEGMEYTVLAESYHHAMLQLFPSDGPAERFHAYKHGGCATDKHEITFALDGLFRAVVRRA